MMRRPIIAGNWKMYNTVSEAIALANEIKRSVFDIDSIDIVICPPFTNLSDVSEILFETNIALGAQNCYWEKEGAFTGEVSTEMLKSVGVSYVILGHSERRKLFGETDEMISKKIRAAIGAGLIPIVCVGETIDEREAGKTNEVVKCQLTSGLKGFSETELRTLVIAYEPVWAIGTGKTATPEQAQEVHQWIRKLLSALYPGPYADTVRILYGGSVKADNIKALMAEKDIDGGLIGGASLKSDHFTSIIKSTFELYSNASRRA